MRGDPEQVHAAGLKLDDERYIHPTQRHGAVDMEQVRGKQRACVSAQEDPPGLVT
jgi:hypothetical protein